MTHHVSAEMESCVNECLRCDSICLGTVMHHCLETGGEHVAPPHFRLMMACADLPNLRPFHADRLAAPQAYLPGVRRDL